MEERHTRLFGRKSHTDTMLNYKPSPRYEELIHNFWAKTGKPTVPLKYKTSSHLGGDKTVKMPEWAQSIIGQAIQEIASGKSDQEVIEKVQGTAVNAVPAYWQEFLRIVKERRRIADKFSRH